ncbi:MAG: YtxH domain-containing protein [Bacillus sp. (in: firmicutes)]
MSSNEYQKEHSRDMVKRDDSGDSINTKDFMIGALIGGITGALAALLLAPKSGRELRQDLNEGAKHLTERTEKLRKTAAERGSEFAEAAKCKTSNLTEAVSKQSAVILDNVKSLRHKEKGNEEDVVSAEDAKRKLEEAQQAFVETEKQLNS